METQINAKIQMRRDTGANWKTKNPVLLAGEFGFDTTKKQTKMGDGITPWVDLEYFSKTAPINSVSFAADSWNIIAAVCANGDAMDTYAVGDEKVIQLSTSEQITLQILGFNHDDLAGGGKASITIGMKNLLTTTYRMNPSPNTNAGGWDITEMRTQTLQTILSQLPSDLQTAIKLVNKPTANNGNQTPVSIINSQDKLFLFSPKELFGVNQYSHDGEGTQYEYFNKNNWQNAPTSAAPNRVKYLANGTGAASNWWLRSPHATGATTFCSILTPGYANYYSASTAYGVCVGFCI